MRHLIVFAASIIAVLLIELTFGGAENSSLIEMVRRFRTTYWADVFCALAYGVVSSRMAVLVGSFGLSLILFWAVNTSLHGLFFAARLDTQSAALNTALYFISVSFLSYWSHRAFHQGWFWNFHRFHHSATSMNPLVETRNHPAQHAVTGALFAVPLILIKVGPDYVAALGIVHSFHQMLVHSNIRSSWGWIGRWVLVSPLTHRVHHSIDPRHHGKNFADDLILWDRLFGTYCSDFAGAREIGVPDVEYNRHGPLYDVLADYGRAARQAFALVKAGATDSAVRS